MANKWAIQNGNWNTGSTWNDGVVPTADDDVWLNGKSVMSFSTESNSVTAKSIHNDLCEETSISGGNMSMQPDGGIECYINADLYGDGVTFIQTIPASKNRPLIVVNGNVYNALIQMSGSNTSLVFNGNMVGTCLGSFGSGSSRTITINGIVTVRDLSFIQDSTYTGAPYAFNINGELIQYRNLTNTIGPTCPMNLTGKWSVKTSGIIYKDNMTLNGTLDIKDTDGAVPIAVGKTFTIGNSSKSFIELGSSEDIPESVVLEGYQYGDKVGTLKTVQGTIIEQATVIEDATVVEEASVVNLTEQQLQRVGNCATVSTVQKCFEEFKEE